MIKRFLSVLAGALIAPVFVMKAYGASGIVVPDERLHTFCKQAGCDYQVFYKYFIPNRDRFCHERDVILKEPDKLAAIRQVVNLSSEYNLPVTVAIVPIMESSLNPKASAGNYKNAAKGFWQFKPATARDMGLVVNEHVDERLDAEKSTRAGLKYLQWLEKKFDGNHDLAVLAFHIGIGRLTTTMASTGLSNPWYLSQIASEKRPSQDYLLKYYSYTVTLMGHGCQ